MKINLGELEYHGLHTYGFFDCDPYFVDDHATEYKDIKQIGKDSAHLYKQGRFFDSYADAKRFLQGRGLLDRDGLERVARASCDWPTNTGYTQIAYNPETGEVCYEEHGSSDNWCQFAVPFVTVLNTVRRVTEQEIVDAINSNVYR